ncbi:hypothetical protein BLNAU_21363 [Blattamonas nauphoetae]|uniref:Uncharacterized protein n=1 Tax=Blattamonas nauphoetae TaxID=2049346 RepID=A0ABQ9WW39_9EUKA|nr:hypothetical protein BLNAU_21363 [Blattamonas nauphoetae]
MLPPFPDREQSENDVETTTSVPVSRTQLQIAPPSVDDEHSLNVVVFPLSPIVNICDAPIVNEIVDFDVRAENKQFFTDIVPVPEINDSPSAQFANDTSEMVVVPALVFTKVDESVGGRETVPAVRISDPPAVLIGLCVVGMVDGIVNCQLEKVSVPTSSVRVSNVSAEFAPDAIWICPSPWRVREQPEDCRSVHVSADDLKTVDRTKAESMSTTFISFMFVITVSIVAHANCYIPHFV